jgi:hypothetical protein
MAAQRTRSRGRRASEKTDRYRFAQNVEGEGTAAEREYGAYALAGIDDPRGDPDVLLDVPVVKVDSVHLELDDLDAHVSLLARVLNLVRLSVGVDVYLSRLRIDLKGVEAQALLKVRLERVTAIVDRVLTTVDRNPELVESLGSTLEDVGRGAEHALGDTGEAVESTGSGTEEALRDVGSGAGEAVGAVGQGAGQTAGEAVGQVGDVAGQAGEGVGHAAGGLSEGTGAALGELEQAVTGALHGNGGADPGALAAGVRPKNVAKLAAKLIAHELKDAAADEAKQLGLAATRKAIEVGERRKQNTGNEHHATAAAQRAALDLGVDLDAIDGTGPDGRVMLRDVRKAHKRS